MRKNLLRAFDGCEEIVNFRDSEPDLLDPLGGASNLLVGYGALHFQLMQQPVEYVAFLFQSRNIAFQRRRLCLHTVETDLGQLLTGDLGLLELSLDRGRQI